MKWTNLKSDNELQFFHKSDFPGHLPEPAETSIPPRRRFADQLSAVRIDANDIPSRGVRKAVGGTTREPLKMAPTAPALNVKEASGRERKVRNRSAISGGRRRRKKSLVEKKFAPKDEDGSPKGQGKAPTLTKGDIGEAGVSYERNLLLIVDILRYDLLDSSLPCYPDLARGRIA